MYLGDCIGTTTIEAKCRGYNNCKFIKLKTTNRCWHCVEINQGINISMNDSVKKSNYVRVSCGRAAFATLLLETSRHHYSDPANASKLVDFFILKLI